MTLHTGSAMIGFARWCDNPRHQAPPVIAVGQVRMFPCTHTLLVCDEDAHKFALLRTEFRAPTPAVEYHCPGCDTAVRGIAIESL